jgi:hypothetical protein
MDPDSWEDVLSPQEYRYRFKDSLATIQLVSRILLCTPYITYKRGPAIDHWLVLAEASHQIWINPEHRLHFFAEIA